MVLRQKTPYDFQLTRAVPEELLAECAELPQAVKGELPEAHPQRMLNFLWEAITRFTDQLHFVDTHATALVTGERPDGVVSVVQRQPGQNLCWAHCISVIEAKPALMGTQLDTAVGLTVHRFIRLRAHQPGREVLVFFLVDEDGVMLGSLRWPDFGLRLSRSFPFDNGQGVCSGLQ